MPVELHPAHRRGMPDRSRELFYDTIADRFDGLMNGYDVERRLAVVFGRLLRDVPLSGRRVLDAGCGTGRFSERAARAGGDVVSFDIGPRLLTQTRRRCGTPPVCGDVLSLPFPDGQFDVVISSECIEHTRDPAAAAAELLRVCRPGGCVVMTCPNRFWRWSCTLAGALRIRPYQGLENWPGWLALRRWVRAAGGTIESHVGLHLFPFVVPALQPLLRRLDRAGGRLGPIYLNQAMRIRK